MKINGPWKIKESKEKYRNPWMRVREDKVIRPDGKNGIVGIVELMDGVSVLPIDKDGSVYLVEQFRYLISKKNIEVVCGGIDNESPLSAAKRELKEETGIIANKWISLGKFNPSTSIIKSSQALYLAHGLKFAKANPEGTEQIKVLKVKFKDAVKMVMEGKITHGVSCILILKANEYLKTRKESEK